jgi:two-component system invasion response regulator UvrY
MRTILIAEEQRLMREGMKRILASSFPLADFGEAATASQTLTQLAEKRWDLLLLNVLIAGGNRMPLLQHIRCSHPELTILVVGNLTDGQSAIRALQCGAAGYLTKQSSEEELIRAATKVAAGGKFVGDSLAESLAACISADNWTPHARLSNREAEVMNLLVSGRTLKEIAAELSLSVKTVSTFHTRIREKLRVHTDVELVRYAFEHNLASEALVAGLTAFPTKIVQPTAHPT